MTRPASSTARILPDEQRPASATAVSGSDQSSAPQPSSANARNRKAQSSHGTDAAVVSAVALDDTAQAWLNAQCDMIAGSIRGIVLNLANETADAQTIARWPHHRTDVPRGLLDAANSALQDQTFVVVANTDAANENIDSRPLTCFVAAPLQSTDSISTVAAFELPDSIRQQQQAIFQLLQWGAVWFGLLRRGFQPATPESRLATVVELLASSLEHSEFNASAITTVTELAAHLHCERVSLGLLRGRSIKVCAISNSARVDTRANLTRDIGAAMHEAIDQGATLTWPLLPAELPHVSFAQEALARHADSASVLSTPLYDGSRAIGALTLERKGSAGFDRESKQICETLAALLGPLLELKHERERPITSKVTTSLREFMARLCGRKHIALKLYALALIATIVFLSFATGNYRITSQAKLESSVMRVVTAPRDGFVASAELRAGDIVQAGDLLASLDNRELQLEQVKLQSHREQLDKEQRAAIAKHDRSTTAIVNARNQQTSAQLALIDKQLSRTQLTAPFAGIVVSGDLSQSIGSPVENGQVLFEIAPLDAYRVVLEVDERDIGDIADNQSGSLTLTGLPNVTLAFTVNRIVPISTPRDGRNFFEVQAELNSPTAALRPGMEGIGKVEVDRRKLIWIWTHELIDWLRLSFWGWM